jgi:hypothetical protein
MDIVQILITATVMTVMSEGLDRWERLALSRNIFPNFLYC